MKNSRHMGLSSMPYQNLKLDGTQRLFIWIPDSVRDAWVAAHVNNNESVEQTMVWYSNRGFCTALVRVCDTCRERWARHKRWTHGSPAFVNFYCDGCAPPLEVQLPKMIEQRPCPPKTMEGVIDQRGDIVGDVPTLFTNQLEPLVERPEPGEKSNTPPKDPRATWNNLLHPNAAIKGRV